MTQAAPAGPWRTCRACGQKKPQAELLRLALAGGLVVPDPGRRLPGRGAYICRQRRCARRLLAGRAKKRIFRVTLGEEAWAGFDTRPEISSLPAQAATS
ncbi:MAG: YlxR family protein [Desulfarculus sp.]|nr:YlxR family protein [Desulfarculus sp.]